MSAATDQYNCESVFIACLALQADLAALNTAGGIVHFDTAEQTSKTSIDRIVVEAMPRTVLVKGYDPNHPVLWSVKLKVEVRMATNNPTLLDTYVAAIHAAMSGNPPAGIVTLVTNLFGSRGFRIIPGDDGERSGGQNERTAMQMWDCQFGS